MPTYKPKHQNHPLWVEPSLTVDEQFVLQCKIIKEFNQRNITKYALFGLSKNFSAKALKRAKMLLFLNFHPDKNPTYVKEATEAFKILSTIAEELESLEAQNHSEANNDSRGQNHSGGKNDFQQKTQKDIPKQDVAKQAYIERLKAFSGSQEDELFFRNILSKYPHFLKLGRHNNTTNIIDLCESNNCSVQFFQWLINTPYAEEVCFPTDEQENYLFFDIVLSGKIDYLKVLWEKYGSKIFQTPDIDMALPFLSSEGKEKDIDMLYYLLKDLGYTPDTYHIHMLLSSTFQYTGLANIELFKDLHTFFSGRNLTIDFDSLFTDAVKHGALEVIRYMLNNKLFPEPHDWFTSFFSHEYELTRFHQKPLARDVYDLLSKAGYSKFFLLSPPKPLLEYDFASAKAACSGYVFTHAFIKEDGTFNENKEAISTIQLMSQQKWALSPAQAEALQMEFQTLCLFTAKEWKRLEQDCQYSALCKVFRCLIQGIDQAGMAYQTFNQVHSNSLEIEKEMKVTKNKIWKYVLKLESFTPFYLFIALVPLHELLPLLLQTGQVNCQMKGIKGQVCFYPKERERESFEIQSDDNITAQDIAETTSNVSAFYNDSLLFLRFNISKAILLYEAESYLFKRTLEDEHKTKLSFFGFQLGFGFSKKEKIDAVRALIAHLKNPDALIPEQHKSALSQGELGKIATSSDLELTYTSDDRICPELSSIKL